MILWLIRRHHIPEIVILDTALKSYQQHHHRHHHHHHHKPTPSLASSHQQPTVTTPNELNYSKYRATPDDDDVDRPARRFRKIGFNINIQTTIIKLIIYKLYFGHLWVICAATAATGGYICARYGREERMWYIHFSTLIKALFNWELLVFLSLDENKLYSWWRQFVEWGWGFGNGNERDLDRS